MRRWERLGEGHARRHPPPPAPSSRPTPRAAAARADRPALSRHRAAPAYPDRAAAASIAVAAAPLAALDPRAVLHRPVPRAAHAPRAPYLQQRSEEHTSELQSLKRNSVAS